MIMSSRKSKMVSFRVSPSEYSRFLEVCTMHGVQSVSELARAAIQGLVAGTITQPEPDVQVQVRTLQDRLDSITLEIERLSRIVQSSRTNGAE